MRARAPASTSNLGPGFDVLGLALGLYLEVEIRPASRLSITATGEGAGLPRDETHLAARVAREVLGHDDVSITISSQIPLRRGLGSSAALCVAAAAAAGASDPLTVAATFDGHAENAAASTLGGLVAGTMIDGKPVARRLGLDARLSFLVLVPDRGIATEDARAVLPSSVDFADAVFNLGRLGLLISGLASRANFVPGAGDDRLHQGARGALFPEAEGLLQGLRELGALSASWSGAGSSLIGVFDDESASKDARYGAESLLKEFQVQGRVLVLEPDTEGLTTAPG